MKQWITSRFVIAAGVAIALLGPFIFPFFSPSLSPLFHGRIKNASSAVKDGLQLTVIQAVRCNDELVIEFEIARVPLKMGETPIVFQHPWVFIKVVTSQNDDLEGNNTQVLGCHLIRPSFNGNETNYGGCLRLKCDADMRYVSIALGSLQTYSVRIAP